MNNFLPKKVEKEIISIRIKTDILNEIDRIATKIEISRNELIVQCIDFALKNFDSE